MFALGEPSVKSMATKSVYRHFPRKETQLFSDASRMRSEMDMWPISVIFIYALTQGASRRICYHLFVLSVLITFTDMHSKSRMSYALKEL
jgi:hypothetical protein